MALRTHRVGRGRLVDGAVLAAARSALEDAGRVTLLVPSLAQALEAQRTLAAEQVALGVTVTTPSAWADELWGLWGDGRTIVSGAVRVCCLRMALDSALWHDPSRAGTPSPGPTLSAGPGMLDALATLARDALPWLLPDGVAAKAVPDAFACALSPGERAALSALGRYARILRERELVERCEAMALLPGLVARPTPVVMAGFPPMSLAVRELACGLAARTDVLVTLAGDGPAGTLARGLADRLERAARSHGVAFERVDPGDRAKPQAADACEDGTQPAPELVALGSALFAERGGREPLVATGAVRLLEPAGPLAEWELVAREVCARADAGARDVAVAVADVDAAWRSLAPKLAARGLSVRAVRTRRATADPAVRGFMGFARTVARLSGLAQTWPEPAPGIDGPVPQLGDMSWWPPRELTDFLASELSGVEPARVWALDARWRGNRILTPDDVLGDLQRESRTSRPVAQATAALLRGRIAAAVQALQPPSGEVPERASGLSCIADAAREVAGLGIGVAGGKAHPRTSVTLGRLVELVDEVARHIVLSEQVRLSPVANRACGQNSRYGRFDRPFLEVVQSDPAETPLDTSEGGKKSSIARIKSISPADAADEATCHVRICSRAEAAALPVRSVDALVVCGLTVDDWPLAPADDAAALLAEHLGLSLRDGELDVARAQFAALVAAPRRTLVLERCLADASAQPSYPAAMYTEALAAYGLAPGGVPAGSALGPMTLSELHVSEHLSAAGTGPARVGESVSAPAGVIGPAAAHMVIVPREGQASLPDGRPALSASQMESYLECPYKWFTLRRLGLGTTDADFSALQMGSFAHRVLELARTGLLRQAAERAGLAEPGLAFDPEALTAVCVAGSAIGPDTIDAARALVNDAFDRHLEHQQMSARTQVAQSLVPHSATERWRLERLRHDLLSVLDFEASRLAGFEPRHFELRFGSARADARHVSYAGADFLGSIDRVDVDAHGRALVIDYKHKGRAAFAAEYDAFSEAAPASASELTLPRRVQALIYAQVVRRLYPELKVVGAVYLSTMGTDAEAHEIAGALDESAFEQVMGLGLDAPRAAHLVVGGPGRLGFDELLDECEQKVALAIERMVAGDIVARPAGLHACQWCPAAGCERRLG